MVGACAGLVYLALRCANGWASSRTFFQPDEYWQSLEIAHRIVFGYGYETWEWTVVQPLRSIVHPAAYVPLYALLKGIGADALPVIMVGNFPDSKRTMPSIQQAIIAWIGDMYFFAYIREVISLRVARTWFIVHGLSLYWTYTCTRPFSNSTEATLFCIALYYWPRELDSGHKIAWMPFAKALLAAFTCILFRPTSLVMWSFLGSKLVIDALRYQSLRVALKCVVLAMLIGVLVLGGGFLLDSIYFGEATWTIRNFFVENVVRSLSSHYGENVWHWYFTVGLPSVLTLLTPFSMFNWWRSLRVLGQGPFHSLAVLCFWTISAYSFLDHKEARFLQPVVPIMHLFAVQLFRPLSDSWKSCWRSIPKVLRYLLISQVPITLYVTMFHAHGQIAVMQYIHSIASPRTSVGFLMPCHSTPWQSHMHARDLEFLDLDNKRVSGNEGRAWFMTCDPPLCHDPSTYWSQTDFFLEDPVKYLTERFPSKVDRSFPPMQVAHFRSPGPSNQNDVFAQHISSDLGWRHTWPTHLVMYSSLLDAGLPMTVGELLTRRGYREEKRFWNALWHPEKERQGDVVVWRYVDDRERFLANYTKETMLASPTLA